METLLNLLSRYGLGAMFVIILLEYACFPVSSEIVLPFSGAVASLQDIPFFVILPLSVLAGLIGTAFCYLVGRFGGNALLNKIMKKFPKTEKGITSSREKFEKYGVLAVCVGRLIPICRTYIAFIAGAAGQKPATFFASSAIGITVWNTVLIGLGYTLRENWAEVSAAYTKYKDVLIPLVLILILFGVSMRRRKPPKQIEDGSV